MKIIGVLLFSILLTAACAQNVTLQKDTSNALTSSSKTIVVPSGGSITATGTGTIVATSAAQLANTLTFGTHLTGTSYNGSAAVTLGTDAASANTASTLVARDSSGNFSAGTITAAFTGNLTGMATSATKLSSVRQILLDGDVSGLVFTDFSGNTSLSTAINSGVVTNAKLADGAVTNAKLADGAVTNAKIATNAAIPDSKLATIATAGKVANSATTATPLNTANAIVSRDNSGAFYAAQVNAASLVGNVTGDVYGNANTVTNGVYTTGSYANPSWITSLANSKITGLGTASLLDSATMATANAVPQAGSDGKLDVSFIPTSDLTIQFRRGTDAERQTVIFASGEPVWTTDTLRMWVGDGTTLGGLSEFALPTQTGNSGKFLTTNGTSSSWATALPPLYTYTPSGESDYDLTIGNTDGFKIHWDGGFGESTVSVSGYNLILLSNGTVLYGESSFHDLATFESGIRVDYSVDPGGSGMKHRRVSTGSVSAGTSALVSISWTGAFDDTNYTVVVSIEDSTASNASLSIVHIESKTVSGITVRVYNSSAGSLTGTVNAIAMHD